MKTITKWGICEINMRINEINDIVDMCDPIQNSDILRECEVELKFLDKKLEKIIKTTKIKKLGLKLILGNK